MDTKAFVISPDLFDHSSWLHGVNHTCRVMGLVWTLGCELGLQKERELAFCAAYIHDMARTHDGICHEHGPKAAETKLPIYKSFFLEQGILECDIPAVYSAVQYHSLIEELEKDHPHYIVSALLKDADALDRIRLGPFDLDARFLRFDNTRGLIKPARKLFLKTMRSSECSPNSCIIILEKLIGSEFLGK